MSRLRISNLALRCVMPIRVWRRVLAFWALSTLVWADPAVPHIIGDHMVLQQERPIHIWGKADPKEKIAVELAGKTSATQADGNGNWSVELPSMRAGGPFDLNIYGKKDLVFKDVMIGEVWIASGQSNMTFALNDSVGGPDEVTKADYPQIRLFTVPKKPAIEPQADTLPTNWQICTPETAKEFSAVAYYFARALQRELNIPIAIIESAWPGTMIEDWMKPDALHRAQASFGTSVDETSSSASKQPFDLQFDDFQLVSRSDEAKAERFSDFDDGTSRNSLGGYWAYDWEGAPQTSFHLISPGHNGTGYAARVEGAIDSSDGSRLIARFHADNSPVDLSAYAGIRFWVRGNGSFRVRTLQPTITDWDDYSSSVVKVTNEWTSIVIRFNDLRQEGWGVVKELTLPSLTGFVIESMPEAGFPELHYSELYNGMITPLMPFNFRGALWYQGESNALDAFRYRAFLPALIGSWRKTANATFPFLIVQLPNHGVIPKEPSDSAWAELREAEFLTSKNLPNVGIAVTIDVGDPNDVHPHRKREVGERLALWALSNTYGQQVVYSGPLYQSFAVEQDKARVRFSNVGAGLVAKDGSALTGFAVAGADHKFYWADAVIQGNTVVVSSGQVLHPVAVRYAWGDSPICNLFNKQGLPASPFRTDDWPGITLPKIATRPH
jgi:sialate O-acetylesterase